ncbi:MAG TPA: porin [Ohtaekwangia sp.]|nr:porin [Ohtaekwangia sp.]
MVNCIMRTSASLTLILLTNVAGVGQIKVPTSYGEGISLVGSDSSFSLTLGARFQPLYSGTRAVDGYTDEFQIRRARVSFEGFAVSPSLQYKFELALSNQDMAGGADPEFGNTANIVLDAYAEWNFYRKWSLRFGQAKLPGNRERIISSQDLQFVDRSEVNNNFNLDRDVGLQILFKSEYVNFTGAWSMGEGRNIIVDNYGGYAYTIRGEYLPFGSFTDDGDYFGADLAREENPKLSIGLVFDFNEGASRQMGQLGDFLTETRDLRTWFADVHFKYRGFSTLIEAVSRTAPDGPVISGEDGGTQSYYTGEGISIQAGYLFVSRFEIAGRVTRIEPDSVTQISDFTQYTAGLSRYIYKHRLKIQGDVSFTDLVADDRWMFRLQAEVSI